MKKVIYIFILTIGFLSCNGQTKKVENSVVGDTTQTKLTGKRQSIVSVKDRTQYDQTFIDGLAGYNGTIKLIDNYLVAGSDTTYFPLDLPLNKNVVFKATQSNQTYVLTVSRTNLTNLTYNFMLTNKKGEVIDSKTGKAVLGPMFFFGSEMDEDTQTGEGYGSYEYWDTNFDSWFAIRIEHGTHKNGKRRAMLTYGSKEENKRKLNLNDCPTLFTAYSGN